MLLDAHIHTKEVSPCSRVPAELLVDICIEDGLGGIVLTNHYKRIAAGDNFPEFRERYVSEYERTRKIGEERGLRVFFGVEFTLDEMPKNDFTVYGLTPEDILRNDALYTLSFSELVNFVHQRKALIYHAHPFRNTEPVDGKFLDGTEINCHPLYRTAAEEKVRAFADKFDLRLSCGSDFHGDTYKPHCGMIVPDEIKTTEELTAFLKEVKRPKLCVAPDPPEDMDVGDAQYIDKRLRS